MICQFEFCQNAASKDLLAATGRQVCVPCATAIANGLAELPNKPHRRHEIVMLLQSERITVSPADARISEFLQYGVTDAQIRGALLIARQRCANPGLAYIQAVLRNERAAKNDGWGAEVKPEHSQFANSEPAKELWELQGFVSEAAYEACDLDYTQHKFKAGAKAKTWRQFMEDWKSEAV
jgi:hypothetical protein